VAGAVLLIWQGRVGGTDAADAGTADATDWPRATPSSRAAEPGTVSPLNGPSRFPGSGAARGTAPDTVRVTPAAGLADGPQHAGADQVPGRQPRSRPGRDGDGKEAVA
jgi:hypothetical protein